MPLTKRITWRLWPFVAGVLALLFILAGIRVLSRTRLVQERIQHELELAQELDQLRDGLHTLGLVHRVAHSSKRTSWEQEREKVDLRVTRIHQRYFDSPDMAELPGRLSRTLQNIDSLYLQSIEQRGSLQARSASDAVLKIMVRQARQIVDQANRNVHERGLAVHAAALNEHWNEARLLLAAAAFLAVLMAWLAGVSNRLLDRSHEQTEQLHNAKLDLEQTNKELRETMLSKEEKEVMIKEIHHRVKNNLQIVKSLIRFQMDQVQEARTLELFNECVNRVSAMALVHEQTYLSKDLANIDVGGYLDSLIRDLVHAYSVGIELKLDLEIQVRTLTVDALVPLGLLINEVISNSFKHAFKGRVSGTIIVHLHGDEASGLHLLIGDDGIGLSDKSRWDKPQSLGMELIQTLAGQLDAIVELSNAPGTVYTLKPEQVSYRKRVA